MRVWRICRKLHAADPLGGRGGLVASGRWHTRGRCIVYTSGTLALAVIEVLVRVDRETWPSDLVQIEIDLPDELAIETIEARALPSNWQDHPPPAALQQIGDRWLARARVPVLRVPSAVIPQESNYLLNPAHGRASGISVQSVRDFAWDPRLHPRKR